MDGIATVRRFNRFYTRRIGVLRRGLLDTPFSLTAARVLYELAHRHDPTATELIETLAIDAAHLSRILRGFEQDDLVKKRRSREDGRRRLLALTRRGRRAFQSLDRRATREAKAMLSELSPEKRHRLLRAMASVERVLGGGVSASTSFVLRPHAPGDIGWATFRHGVLYAQEYGWDERFEALVGDVLAQFLKRFDPERERAWIVERDGERVGCVFCVKKSRTVAKLRCLLVEPEARGLGLGKALVDECVRFARRSDYRKMILWTNDVLRAAHGLYVKAGFERIDAAPHTMWGEGLVGETWEKKL